MPMTRRNKGEKNSEPVLSRYERPEEIQFAAEETLIKGEDATPSIDVVITPPVVIIDEKKPKKDK